MAKDRSMGYKIGVVIAVVALLVTAVLIKQRPAKEAGATQKALPAVVDLGMGKCIACKRMKPILEELALEYEGRAVIQIIDIGEQPAEGQRYRVELIPTQIFLDANGNEVDRHVGFMPKEDIVTKLQAMGVK